MNENFPSLAELLAEEEELQFQSFTNDDAWELGCRMVQAARSQNAPVAIDITRNGHQLFHAALPGTSADNDGWIQRKIRVVQRFGHSSLATAQVWRERGVTVEEALELDSSLYAAHGGGYPVNIRSVGSVGVIAVSGLPQLDDHAMVVTAIRSFLSI